MQKIKHSNGAAFTNCGVNYCFCSCIHYTAYPIFAIMKNKPLIRRKYLLKMRPEIKSELLAALRSGVYKKTNYLLCKDIDLKCMCTEGVLCDLYAKHHPNESSWEVTDNGSSVNIHFQKNTCTMPAKVTSWAAANFPYQTPIGTSVDFFVGENKVPLTDTNDECETFEQVAQQIEKYL